MRIFMMLLGMCLIGCSMLKQSSKTEGLEQAEFEKVVDSRSLVLRTAVRETSTLTYNPDGSILQFQQVQEKIAQSETLQVLGKEIASVKKELLLKESVPWKGWVWVAGLGISIIAVFIYVKMFR